MYAQLLISPCMMAHALDISGIQAWWSRNVSEAQEQLSDGESSDGIMLDPKFW